MDELIRILMRFPAAQTKPPNALSVLEPYLGYTLNNAETTVFGWHEHILLRATLLLAEQGALPTLEERRGQSEWADLIMSIPKEENAIDKRQTNDRAL